MRWQTQTSDFENSFINGVTIVDDYVIVVNQPTQIVALSVDDGERQWEVPETIDSIAPRAVYISSHNGKIYIMNSNTYILDVTSGTIENVIELDTRQMQFMDGYLLDEYGAYDVDTLDYKFDLEVPSQELPFRTCDGFRPPYAGENSSIFAVGKCGGIYALNMANGQIKWEYMPKMEASPPLAVVQDNAYVLLGNGEIHAIAADTGVNIGILATSAPLAGYAVGDLTSLGIVTNGKLLVVTFNEPTVLGLGLDSD